MKTLSRLFLVQLFSLWLTFNVFKSAISFTGDWIIYLLAAGILTLLNLLLKPILKLLFLPVNMVTFGLFTLFINAGIFYLFVRIIPQISLSEWVFQGISVGTFIVEPMTFHFWVSLFIISLFLTFSTNFLFFLVK